MTGYQGSDGRFTRVPIEDRFWSKVDKSAGRTECWIWQGPLETNGYGRITDYWDKHLAHRIAYELVKGPIPKGRQVCHSCDNRACVNPKHLWLGSAFDNMQDASAKGRMCRNGNPNPKKGSDAPNSKLTAKDVRAIHKAAATYRANPNPKLWRGTNPGTVRGLAEKYGVAPSLIQRIIKGESWSHIK